MDLNPYLAAVAVDLEKATALADDGYCPETKRMACVDGYCQQDVCTGLDGGCDYDLYGPSPFKGNRNVGPAE